jgi:hypothetical protein
VKSAGVICGSISRKTGHGLPASAVISAALRLTVMAAATRVVAILIAVEATTAAAAVVAAATVVPSTGRRSPRAVAEGCAEKSEACSGVVLLASFAS